jgi:multidrug efflux pump subunit AcrB
MFTMAQMGIVVDDAILTSESIFAEQEAGKRMKTAVLTGVGAIRTPIAVGALTTVAAFAPLTLTTGTLGRITANDL